MTISLNDKDRRMLNGDHGAATKMAMSILVRMAEISGAKELLDITGAHIDSTVYIGDAGLEFAEKLASLGAKVSVPTTLNVSGSTNITGRNGRFHLTGHDRRIVRWSRIRAWERSQPGRAHHTKPK